MAVLRSASLVVVAALFVAVVPQAADEQVLRTPSMPEWQLVHKVVPEYPAAAVRHHIEGTVRFNAVIGTDGRVERLRLISGHPLLTRAAGSAARQWIYRPSLRGSKPVRVITTIEVHFRLDPYSRPLEDNSRKPQRLPVL
jgi:TonB family protein